MNYPINKEFGIFAHLHPPICRPLLPCINAILTLLPWRPPAGISARKLRIPRAGGNVAALLLEPEDLPSDAPLLVYFHGGGFVMQAAANHFAITAAYARAARCRVLLPTYRLAPRHPFPVPMDDCFCVYRWASDNARALGVDPLRIAVGGDSAGGCLAAAVALAARDRGVRLPCFSLLVYPVLDRRMETESMRLFPDTPMWNARLNRKMWRWYLPEAPSAPIAYASPAEVPSLAGLPDAYIETAEFDCLRDEGITYAASLQQAGVTVELNRTCGTMHGFDTVLNSPAVQACMTQRIDALCRAFAAKT